MHRSALFLSLAILAHPAHALCAFPGAEGFGTATPGGRGGKVLFVDNTDDSGPGSLRAALAATHRRIVVFRTGGLIELTSDLKISKPYITVAGQTAPGDGICIQGGSIWVKTHDVVIRGLRVRPGDDGEPPSGDNRDAIGIGTGGGYKKSTGTGNAHDIVIDHCSFTWSTDETVSVWYRNRDITIQNCIIAEALHWSIHSKSQKPPPSGQSHPWGHGFACSVGGGGTRGLSMHHNLWAHNWRRNPRVGGNLRMEFVNNVIYDYGDRAFHFVDDKTGPIHINVIRNYCKPGPSTKYMQTVHFHAKHPPEKGSAFHLEGNIDGVRISDDRDQWDAAYGFKDMRKLAEFRVDEPAFEPSGITTQQTALAAYEHVLENVGAVPRDAVDTRIIESVRDGTGKVIDSVDEVGGYPAYDRGVPPGDADADGMPDAWETARGLAPDDAADAALTTLSREGYTNIELYINSIFDPDPVSQAPPAVVETPESAHGEAADLAVAPAPALEPDRDDDGEMGWVLLLITAAGIVVVALVVARTSRPGASHARRRRK